MEKEKARLGHSEEREKDELEDLKFSLEDQKQRNTQLNLLLEQQKQLLNESQQKVESQRILYDAKLAEEQGRNLELQVLLDSEKSEFRSSVVSWRGSGNCGPSCRAVTRLASHVHPCRQRSS